MSIYTTNSSLKNVIVETLKPLIDGDYCLLDVPTYRNIGDLIIWQGELEFLKNNILHKMTYSASLDSFDVRQVKDTRIILLQGGGNFGDLWPKHQIFREDIINRFKDRKIIIFPQTVYFSDQKQLNRAARIFSTHPDLTICARDNVTYSLLKSNFKRNNILLLPDMAFCFSPLRAPKNNFYPRVLYISRADKEMKEKFSLDFIKNLETHDWPTYEMSLTKKIFYFSRKIIWKVGHVLTNRKFDSFAYKNRINYIKKGINFLSSYDLVITDRLHGQIFSSLLGIPSILLDNSYGKNKNFYYAWLKNNDLCYFANNESEVKSIFVSKFSNYISDHFTKR